MTTHRVLAALLATSLLVSACGDADETSTTGTAESTDDTSETTEASGATGATAPSAGLPGERVEIHPYEGAALGVVGVEADDTLNVRSGPGVDHDVVAELDPLADGIVATGHNRSIDDRSWVEVEVDDRTGWANVRFLAHLGSTDDVTSQMAPGDLPRAETTTAARASP